MKIIYERGDKVQYEGKFYDFGYYGQTGLAIIYEEGECNMQDSIAVGLPDLSSPKLEEMLLQYCGDNVGVDCTCGTCERERDGMRKYLHGLTLQPEVVA